MCAYVCALVCVRVPIVAGEPIANPIHMFLFPRASPSLSASALMAPAMPPVLLLLVLPLLLILPLVPLLPRAPATALVVLLALVPLALVPLLVLIAVALVVVLEATGGRGMMLFAEGEG